MERRSWAMLSSLLQPGIRTPARGSARAALTAAAGRWFACCLLGMLSTARADTAESVRALSAPLAAQPLAQALVEFAHQTGLQLLYESKLAAQRQSHDAAAGLAAADALTQILQGTGLNFQFLNPKTVRIYEPAVVTPAVQQPATDLPKPRDEPTHRVDTLDEILVAGTRRKEHLSDLEDVQNIPSSVSVVSGTSLEDGNALQLSDYSAYVPGVNVISGGMPGASGVAIRGISPLSQNAAVAFYLDDVPIGASGRWGYPGGTALDLLPYDLERLEVQRGPQGTYGGAGAEIGSIKYVLSPPDPSAFAARVGADVSTIHGGSLPGGSVRAMLNAPLIDELLAVRATAYDSYTPGYIDNAYSGAKDINALREYGGRIAALWRPAQSLSLTVTAFYNLIEQDSQSEVLSRNAAIVPGNGDAYIVTGVGSYGGLTDSLAFLSPFEKSLHSYSASLRWNPGFAELSSVTGWSRNHEHYVNDETPFDGSYFPVLSGGAVPAGLAKLVEDVYLDKLTEELRIAPPPGRRIDWLMGAFYTRERVDHWLVEHAFDDAYQPIAAFAPYFSFFYQPSAFSEIAAFGDVMWELSDQLEIAAGVRSARDTQNYTNFVAGEFFIPSVGQGTDTITDWMTSVRYRIVPQVMMYGRVSTGSQPNALTDAERGISGSYKGETVTNYEVGVKTEFLERRALMDLTLFYLNRDRILTSIQNSGVFHATANGGAATAKGLELTSSYSPLQGFKLGYNAAYTQSAYTHVNPAAQYQLTGYPLKNVPKWDMSITAAYEWPLTDSWQAHVGGDFHWVGQQWGSYVQSRALGGYPAAAVPSYTLLDLNTAIAQGPVSVKFFARNLIDKRAYLNSLAIANDFNAVVQVQNYVLQPRTVGVGFDCTF
jgi:iron complex outermembrane receptor protein